MRGSRASKRSSGVDGGQNWEKPRPQRRQDVAAAQAARSAGRGMATVVTAPQSQSTRTA